MTHYGFYFHDANGHFNRREDVDVVDDAAALEAARAIDHAHCIEVWNGASQVGLVKPEDDAERPA